jgi:hypothetical protein
MRKLLLHLALSGCVACQSLSTADLARCLSEQGVALTAGDAPANAQPLRALAFQRNGFYLAGLLPVVGVDLEDAVRAVAQEARALDADGIAHLRFDYSPASFFKFLVFPIPDWSASLSITGIAYRLPR